ncbi:MAG: NfeD family protein [Alphaproteobacteria bacterium]|nr:MAG: NfeD family protein [Alphaproteobacteria bacterium]
MEDFVFEFWTVWSWLAIGVGLIIVEMIAPGLIFVWFGVAGIVTGLVVGVAPMMAWPAQLTLFSVLALVSLVSGRMWLKKHPLKTQDESLNRRADQYVDRTFTLSEAIVNGQGKVQVDDSIWKVRGPDMDLGSLVRVVGTDGTVLNVEAET